VTATTERPAPVVGRNLPRDLARSAAAPLLCVLVLTGLLSAWVVGGGADELTAVSSPIASRVVLTERVGVAGPRTVVGGLVIPARGTLTLSPFGDDVVLQDLSRYEHLATVPLTLSFRHSGTVTIDAAVTQPGTP